MNVKIMKKVMESNIEIAEENRQRFAAEGVAAINVMASPGAGKTSVILALLARLAPAMPTAVIEGDIASTIDAEKIEALGIPVVQINTGGGCHLDANSIREAANDLGLTGGMLLIENVGNLVCPASYDLGEDLRLVLMSVTEGEDKPLKYPTIFNTADVAIITKIDLAAAVEFDLAAARQSIQSVRPGMQVFEVSAKTGAGMDVFLAFLETRIAEAAQRLKAAPEPAAPVAGV